MFPSMFYACFQQITTCTPFIKGHLSFMYRLIFKRLLRSLASITLQRYFQL